MPFTPKQGSRYATSTVSAYLIDVANLADGECLYICDANHMNTPTVKAMQDALNAQYGQGQYKAHSHGSARYVTKKPTWDKECKYEDNSCEQNWDPILKKWTYNK